MEKYSCVQVESGLFRYVIPFYYEKDFTSACKEIDQQKKFEGIYKNDLMWKKNALSEQSSESELFDYVNKEFCVMNPEDEISDNLDGCRWNYCKSEADPEAIDKAKRNAEKHILQFKVATVSAMNEVLKSGAEFSNLADVNLDDAGILLCRNGIGFLWYDLSFLPNKKVNLQDILTLKRMDTSENTEEKDSRLDIIKFQNDIKELNSRSKFKKDSVVLWSETRTLEDGEFGLKISRCDKSTEYESFVYLRPFFLGRWAVQILDSLEVTFWASRNNSFNNALFNLEKEFRKISEEAVVGTWDFSENSGQSAEQKVPDKALLFNYLFLDDDHSAETKLTDREKRNLSFWMTRGFNMSYLASDEELSEVSRPFENEYWYAAQEGVSCIGWKTEDGNNVFYKGQKKQKVASDYFTLYLKTLYQSFSLLKYADETNNVGKSPENIDELYKKMNDFLMKSMATSVSHTHHQSEFYVYLKKRLRISEDVESVTAGLDAMDGIIRQQQDDEGKKRDNLTQVVLGFVSVLSIISAFNDWHQFSEGDPCWLQVFINIVIAIVAFAALLFLVGSLRILFLKELKKKKRQKNNGGNP